MTDPRRPAELSHDEVVDLAASFVLGALDEDEMAAVRAHLASCAESHAEFDELGGMRAGAAGKPAPGRAAARPQGSDHGRRGSRP